MNILRTLTAACAVGFLGCSGNADPGGPDDPTCIIIQGVGQLSGDRDKLTGDHVISFDGVERPGEVGLYLFSMAPEEGGIRVDTQYQFNWDNGDTFLTREDAFFEPSFEADRYTFKSELLFVAGAGIFADQVGKKRLTLNAVIQFGPPPNPGDLQSAEETFDIGGSICSG
jgi:hypothetical protein